MTVIPEGFENQVAAKKPAAVKVPTITTATIAQLAQKLFQNFGFAVPTNAASVVQVINHGTKTGNGYIRIEWPGEYATGMAAFSQRDVFPTVRLYVPETNGKTVEPWNLWQVEVPADQRIELEVRYTHHNGGSNGFGREYMLQLPTAKGEEVRLINRPQ